jgi:hypothetical protein
MIRQLYFVVSTVVSRRRRASVGGLGGRGTGGGVARLTSASDGSGPDGTTVSRRSRSSSGTVIGISPASSSEQVSCWRCRVAATAR